MAECLLRMEHITKKFGVFTANRDISLTLHEGEVLTLLGENGAGKSTLMNVLCGLYHPTEGKIFLHGQEVRLTSPASAVQRGIGMVHQHFMLVEAMTVFQNIILGLSQERSVLIHAGKLRAQIQALSEKYGLEVSLDQKITELSVGAQQRVEILKALWRGAEILILDEPTAVLTDEETEGLFAIIRRLQQEGKGILFISHKLREVMAISDRILVLRRGEAVAEITDMTQANEQTLASTMVGSQVETCIYEKSTAQAGPILELRQVCYHAASKHNGLDHVDLDLCPGEILGIAGVDGNGQSQLAQAVTGLLTPESGQIVFHGQTVTRFDPGWFIRRQVAHIPEDRNRMGLAGAMSIQENLMMKLLPSDRRVRWRGWGLNRRVIARYAETMREKYDIRCHSTQQPVASLSGGNQQKVILARELEQQPDVLIAAHPIRGLDIGAAAFVHEYLVQAKHRGCAVLLISADLAEILQLADRIAVCYEGRILGVFDGKDPPVEEISLAMAGRSVQNSPAGCVQNLD